MKNHITKRAMSIKRTNQMFLHFRQFHFFPVVAAGIRHHNNTGENRLGKYMGNLPIEMREYQQR